MIGQIAGGINSKSGYRMIHVMVDGKDTQFHAYYLIWLHQKGTQPDGEIDHRNRIKSDDRIDNLRVATRRQQILNRNIGPTAGTSLNRGKYQARASDGNGNVVFLGRYATIEEAHEVYLTYCREHPEAYDPDFWSE